MVSDRRQVVAASTAKSQDTAHGGVGFAQLPGEIRNQVYKYATYPELTSLTIVFCTLPEHFGATVFKVPLFRASRQVRIEAISHLCATKRFHIVSIETANLFFDFIGASIGDIKDLLLKQPAYEITPGNKEEVVRFFRFIAEAKALKRFCVSGMGDLNFMAKGGEPWAFMMQVQALEERGVKVDYALGTNWQ